MNRITAALVSGLLLAPAASANWEFQTTATASVTHTDNVALDLPDQEESDTILVLTPTFSLSQQSSRLLLNLLYNPQAVFYDKADDADQVFHVLDGVTFSVSAGG